MVYLKAINGLLSTRAARRRLGPTSIFFICWAIIPLIISGCCRALRPSRSASFTWRLTASIILFSGGGSVGSFRKWSGEKSISVIDNYIFNKKTARKEKQARTLFGAWAKPTRLLAIGRDGWSCKVYPRKAYNCSSVYNVGTVTLREAKVRLAAPGADGVFLARKHQSLFCVEIVLIYLYFCPSDFKLK